MKGIKHRGKGKIGCDSVEGMKKKEEELTLRKHEH